VHCRRERLERCSREQDFHSEILLLLENAARLRPREPRERLPRSSARPETALADSGLAHEKGGVVRRPFSKLQAWLIAVSPQPGVALAIGSGEHRLER
jgi:hypothetical protein